MVLLRVIGDERPRVLHGNLAILGVSVRGLQQLMSAGTHWMDEIGAPAPGAPIFRIAPRKRGRTPFSKKGYDPFFALPGVAEHHLCRAHEAALRHDCPERRVPLRRAH